MKNIVKRILSLFLCISLVATNMAVALPPEFNGVITHKATDAFLTKFYTKLGSVNLQATISRGLNACKNATTPQAKEDAFEAMRFQLKTDLGNLPMNLTPQGFTLQAIDALEMEGSFLGYSAQDAKKGTNSFGFKAVMLLVAAYLFKDKIKGGLASMMGKPLKGATTAAATDAVNGVLRDPANHVLYNQVKSALVKEVNDLADAKIKKVNKKVTRQIKGIKQFAHRIADAKIRKAKRAADAFAQRAIVQAKQAITEERQELNRQIGLQRQTFVNQIAEEREVFKAKITQVQEQLKTTQNRLNPFLDTMNNPERLQMVVDQAAATATASALTNVFENDKVKELLADLQKANANLAALQAHPVLHPVQAAQAAVSNVVGGVTGSVHTVVSGTRNYVQRGMNAFKNGASSLATAAVSHYVQPLVPVVQMVALPKEEAVSMTQLKHPIGRTENLAPVIEERSLVVQAKPQRTESRFKRLTSNFRLPTISLPIITLPSWANPLRTVVVVPEPLAIEAAPEVTNEFYECVSDTEEDIFEECEEIE